MIKVEVRKGQSVEKAISIFKKKVKQSGLMLELRERSFFTKKSDLLREKKKKAILRNKYKVLINQSYGTYTYETETSTQDNLWNVNMVPTWKLATYGA